MEDTLPNNMSDVLELALNDLKAVERDVKYEVNMFNWHQPIRDGKCQVCFAGSVIAKSLKIPIYIAKRIL